MDRGLGGYKFVVDFESLPNSVAEVEFQIENTLLNVTSTFHKDEKILYDRINEKLKELEAGAVFQEDLLVSLENITKGFMFALKEKEDLLLRIHSMINLYFIKRAITNVDSIVEAKHQLMRLSDSLACPLKTQLHEQTVELISSMQAETEKPLNGNQSVLEKVKSAATADELFHNVIEHVGNAFMNLGKEGQVAVAHEVFKKKTSYPYFDEVLEDMEQISYKLEKHVASLPSSQNDIHAFANHLAELPIKCYVQLHQEDQLNVAKQVLNVVRIDKGFAYLAHRVTQLVHELEKKRRNIKSETVFGLTVSKSSFLVKWFTKESEGAVLLRPRASDVSALSEDDVASTLEFRQEKGDEGTGPLSHSHRVK